jgi:integrase
MNQESIDMVAGNRFSKLLQGPGSSRMSRDVTVQNAAAEFVEIKNVTKRQKQRVLTYDEFWALLTFVDEPYRTMVLVTQCLGLRISEVMALQWSDFDFDNLAVRVQRGIVHGRVDVVKTEYSNDDLPLDSNLRAILKHWKN